MKIAIQGHPTRGKEVISLLESFGCIKSTLKGDGECYTYYIDKNNVIRYDNAPKDYKVYTLEEFEQEFPFKIGDRVITNESCIGIIEKLIPEAISAYYVKINNIGGGYWCTPSSLRLCEEMKEERNITLTLDKAKEWYKKGGELKEIALQAFSEKELTKTDLPKTWKEFCENYPVQAGECWLGTCDKILKNDSDEERVFRNWIPSRKSAEAHLAMIQLEQLRDCWRQGWEPNWLDNTTNYVIKGLRDSYSIENVLVTHEFLSFPTYEMAKEFLKCFKDLIEKAGDLI